MGGRDGEKERERGREGEREGERERERERENLVIGADGEALVVGVLQPAARLEAGRIIIII